MAYDPGAIDAALAAAVGDEPALIAELRFAFVEGARGCAETLAKVRDPDAWRAEAYRLKGLAASFGAIRLMALAQTAADAQPGDMAVLARLERAIERL